LLPFPCLGPPWPSLFAASGPGCWIVGLGGGAMLEEGAAGVLVLTGCGVGVKEDGSIASATTEMAKAIRTAAAMAYVRPLARRRLGGGGGAK
jgi:hypothetical protein